MREFAKQNIPVLIINWSFTQFQFGSLTLSLIFLLFLFIFRYCVLWLTILWWLNWAQRKKKTKIPLREQIENQNGIMQSTFQRLNQRTQWSNCNTSSSELWRVLCMIRVIYPPRQHRQNWRCHRHLDFEFTLHRACVYLKVRSKAKDIIESYETFDGK